MSAEIEMLNPRELWSNFYLLTQIPRPSKKEQKAALAVKEFGEKLGLETRMDEAGNVIIKKPASSGFENRKGIILQAHIDMVPQANSGVNFNFETDAIQTYIDGDWLTAKDTTLGADNGIGVAAAMAVLAANNLEHGPLEVLITVDEETGMTGAFGLEKGLLIGDILINLDTEDEEEISVGCAGGVDVNALWKFESLHTNEHTLAYRISISGLNGGHSGLDINLGRGNACKLMGHLLKRIIVNYGARLAKIDCGNMRNAIPREGESIIVIEHHHEAAFLECIEKTKAEWINELGRVEPNLQLSTEQVNAPSGLLPEMIQDDVVNAICAAPNGVIRMSDTMPGVVETSNNLSIVSSSDSAVEIQCLTRSFIDASRDTVASSLESLFTLAGAKAELKGEYPGWKPNPDSEILKIMRDTYSALRKSSAREVAMHAGLECGILGAKYPHWDMVSMGPTIKHPHSPFEKVHIESVARFWEFLLAVLKNAPEKKE